MSVYRVTDIIGTSEKSWEDAAREALSTAAESLRDLRVAEVVAEVVVAHGHQDVGGQVGLDHKKAVVELGVTAVGLEAVDPVVGEAIGVGEVGVVGVGAAGRVAAGVHGGVHHEGGAGHLFVDPGRDPVLGPVVVAGSVDIASLPGVGEVHVPHPDDAAHPQRLGEGDRERRVVAVHLSGG